MAALRFKQAEWLKPRQHICVALATACWTGGDHWIQMWKSFGVPVPISWTQLLFSPLWILELGYDEQRLGKSNSQALHPNQAAPGGRNSKGGNTNMIQNKRRHVVKTFSLAADPPGGRHLFARIHIWMCFKERKNADDLLSLRQRNVLHWH